MTQHNYTHGQSASVPCRRTNHEKLLTAMVEHCSSLVTARYLDDPEVAAPGTQRNDAEAYAHDAFDYIGFSASPELIKEVLADGSITRTEQGDLQAPLGCVEERDSSCCIVVSSNKHR